VARILVTWELGEGLGHLAGLAPIVRECIARGHEVFAAVRDTAKAKQALAESELQILQAPAKYRLDGSELADRRTYADVLYNTGFGRTLTLAGLMDAWSNLFRLVDPDLALFEHSPGAVLASRGHRCKRVLIGTGFVCPPALTPFPDPLRLALGGEQPPHSQSEDTVLRNVNSVLSQRLLPELTSLAELVAQVDDTLLLTIPELDHYGIRSNVTYWGVNTCIPGARPKWHSGNHSRVFCYLKPTPTLVDALVNLRQPDYDVIAFIPGLEATAAERLTSESFRLVSEPLDMTSTMDTCHLAILNATHGATAAALLAGKPSIHLPMYLEQSLIARCVQLIGAGVGISQRQAQTLSHAVAHVLSTPAFTRNAQSARDRHSSFDPRVQSQAIVDRLDGMVRSRD
jgi:UDP:flavonoid glycosyltransferase YjiC (YdhE family)